MRPVILLTCGGGEGAAASSAPAPGRRPRRADFGPSGRAGAKTEYIRSVEVAGGTPLLLPNSPDETTIADALALADGLLLTGGGDVAPQRYGQTAHPSVGRVDPLRDATEIQAIREALRRDVPILGICRGIQVINVALGGTLIQDIAAHFGPDAAVNHRGVDHPVRVEPGSSLAEIWPGGELRVNSRHHQAVGRLGEGLKAIAWAPDGIVEGVESADGSAVLGLQCHPEDLAAARAEFLAPFAWLVSTGADRRRARPGGA